MGHIHGSGRDGWVLDECRPDAGVPGKKQPVGGMLLGSLVYLKIVWPPHGVLCGPLAKTESRVLVQTRRTLKVQERNLEGLEGSGSEPWGPQRSW